MKKINDIIKQITIKDIENYEINYSDYICVKDIEEEINKNSIDWLNYWYWKFYTGKITKVEFDQISNETLKLNDIYKIYKIIFEIKEKIQEYQEINAEHLEEIEKYIFYTDELIDLWIIKSNEFIYKKELEILIFIVYCNLEILKSKSLIENNEKILKSIALNFYKNNAYAKEYVKNKPIESSFLIHNKDDAKYNKKYGIKETFKDNNSNI